jgi:hypothetical protein
MPNYLFERDVEPALQGAKADKAQIVQTKCMTVTSRLQGTYQLGGGANIDAAKAIARRMGVRDRRDLMNDQQLHQHHASRYCDWNLVSNNAQHIVGMVCGELQVAVDLGIDISRPEVIGAMFDLAVQVWSGPGPYTGYDQGEGRR